MCGLKGVWNDFVRHTSAIRWFYTSMVVFTALVLDVWISFCASSSTNRYVNKYNFKNMYCCVMIWIRNSLSSLEKWTNFTQSDLDDLRHTIQQNPKYLSFLKGPPKRYLYEMKAYLLYLRCGIVKFVGNVGPGLKTVHLEKGANKIAFAPLFGALSETRPRVLFWC